MDPSSVPHRKPPLKPGLIGVLALVIFTATSCVQQSREETTPTLESSSSFVSPLVVVSTRTPSPSLTPTNTSSPFPTATQLRSPTPSFPEEHYINGVQSRQQYFTLGCEASAAVDLAAYFGIKINEFEFQHNLPLSDNPDLGFVGNVDSPWGQVPPYAYGVHARPVADLLSEYGLPAKGIKNFSIEELKKQIAQDHPVIAWVIGNCEGGVPYEFTDQEGNTTTVAAYEHVIIVTGYNKETIRYMTNGNIYEAPIDVFTNSWSVLKNMVVIQEE